jgi:hypothetical protein
MCPWVTATLPKDARHVMRIVRCWATPHLLGVQLPDVDAVVLRPRDNPLVARVCCQEGRKQTVLLVLVAWRHQHRPIDRAHRGEAIVDRSTARSTAWTDAILGPQRPQGNTEIAPAAHLQTVSLSSLCRSPTAATVRPMFLIDIQIVQRPMFRTEILFKGCHHWNKDPLCGCQIGTESYSACQMGPAVSYWL